MTASDRSDVLYASAAVCMTLAAGFASLNSVLGADGMQVSLPVVVAIAIVAGLAWRDLSHDGNGGDST